MLSCVQNDQRAVKRQPRCKSHGTPATHTQCGGTCTSGETPRKPAEVLNTIPRQSVPGPQSPTVCTRFAQTMFHFILWHWIWEPPEDTTFSLQTAWKERCSSDGYGLQQRQEADCVHFRYLPHIWFYEPLNSCQWQVKFFLRKMGHKMMKWSTRVCAQESRRVRSQGQVDGLWKLVSIFSLPQCRRVTLQRAVTQLTPLWGVSPAFRATLPPHWRVQPAARGVCGVWGSLRLSTEPVSEFGSENIWPESMPFLPYYILNWFSMGHGSSEKVDVKMLKCVLCGEAVLNAFINYKTCQSFKQATALCISTRPLSC